MNRIKSVVLDSINDVEIIVNELLETRDECKEVDKLSVSSNGIIEITFNGGDIEYITIEKLLKEMSSYESIEYIGGENFKCEEVRDWETLTDEEKRLFKNI